MSDLKHTPGPWVATQNEAAAWAITTAGPLVMFVCEVNGPYTPSMDRYEADARLIAAAPDLLAACELVLKRWGCYDFVSVHDAAMVGDVRAAVERAKARRRKR